MKRLGEKLADGYITAATVFGGLFIVVVLLGLVFFGTGCKDTLPTEAPGKSLPTQDPPRLLNTFNLPTDVKNVVRDKCAMCHRNAPYPAGVEIHPGNPWTMVASSAQFIHDAMCDDRAPAHVALTGPERDVMNEWTLLTLGVSPTSCTVPSTLYWSMEDQLDGLNFSEGGDQPGGFFGFAIEDNTRTVLTLGTHTDNTNSLTYDELRMADYTAVPNDSFASNISDDPTNYVLPAGVPYATRIKDFVAEGHIRVDNQLRLVMHTQSLFKPAGNQNSRGGRTYVALGLEDDGWLGFRMKKVGVADNYETVQAWYNNPSSLLEEDGSLPLIDGTLGGIIYERFYWLHVCSYRDGEGIHYHAEVWTRKPGTTGAGLLGEVGALRTIDQSTAFGGFEWAWYPRNETGKHNTVAETFEVTASSIQGSGTGQGGSCSNCELEPPVRVSGPRIGKRALEAP